MPARQYKANMVSFNVEKLTCVVLQGELLSLGTAASNSDVRATTESTPLILGCAFNGNVSNLATLQTGEL